MMSTRNRLKRLLGMEAVLNPPPDERRTMLYMVLPGRNEYPTADEWLAGCKLSDTAEIEGEVPDNGAQFQRYVYHYDIPRNKWVFGYERQRSAVTP